jgi:hypothetical protein
MTRHALAPADARQHPGGGECPTTRPDCPAPPAPADRQESAVRADDDLDAYVKKVVDALPPLTGKQRDILANLLRARP